MHVDVVTGNSDQISISTCAGVVTGNKSQIELCVDDVTGNKSQI